MDYVLDLSAFHVHGDAEAYYHSALSFVSPRGRWHYAISISCPVIEAPAVLEIETQIGKGAVGFGLNDGSFCKYVTGEITAYPQDRRQRVRILVENPQADLTLVARNVASSGERSEGTIYRAGLHPASRYSNADIKRLRAARHSYWHYSFDLGDGVSVQATHDGVMDFHRLRQQILFGLLDRGFGALVGLEVLDAACSSGFHSFALARKGMKVTGIDIDKPSIEQARFVQSCFTDAAARSVEFQCADLLTYSREQPFSLFFCSGLFYHLRDLVGGAKRLYDLTSLGGVVHSSVAAGEGEYMELANAAKYICCFEGEFSFVPTASMLTRIFQYVGFQEVQVFKSTDLSCSADSEALVLQYRDIFRRNTAFWILKKQQPRSREL